MAGEEKSQEAEALGVLREECRRQKEEACHGFSKDLGKTGPGTERNVELQ